MSTTTTWTDPEKTYNAAIEAELQANGGNHTRALKAVERTHPGLRVAAVMACNEKGGRNPTTLTGQPR